MIMKTRAPMSERGTRYPGPITEAAFHPHSLIAQGFAEDAALAEVLDRYPAELFDINLYDYDDEGQVSLRTGARGRRSIVGGDPAGQAMGQPPRGGDGLA